MDRLAVRICATFLAGVLPLMAQTGNISKQRREELTAKLGEIKDFLQNSGDTNATRLLSFAAELEKELRGKKYGLVFEQHIERVDVELQGNLPTLTEAKDRYLENDPAAPLNFILEGDNLAALKLLEKTHKGRIDLIYIDPPYNTGNKDFVYNDSYVDKTDTFRHSKWLSFMQKRLEIAKRLMSEKGVIFISIDDNEQAALKLLCDEVFGDSNFISNVIWHSKYTTSNDTRGISRQHESIVVFARDIKSVDFGLLERTDKMNASYKNPDNDPNGPWKATPLHAKSGTSNSLYTVEFPNGRMWTAPKGRYPRYSKETLLKIYEQGGLYFRKSGGIDRKTYLSEVKKGKVAGSVWRFDEVGSTHQANEELAKLMGKGVFDNPKPIELIIRCIQLGTTKKELTVLDFFAGSGTTGHAVMKLNVEDGGKRNFILVTNNENGICEKITYERIKRVMEKEKYPARLKYMKIDYLPISGKLYYEYADELLQHIRELVELENAVDISHDASTEIVLTDDELAALIKSKARMKKCKSVYIGHDVLVGSDANDAFERHGIEAHRIPQYYYPEMEG